jgi:hypothetical protein
MVRPGRDKLAGEVEVDESYLGGVAPGKHHPGLLLRARPSDSSVSEAPQATVRVVEVKGGAMETVVERVRAGNSVRLESVTSATVCRSRQGRCPRLRVRRAS